MPLKWLTITSERSLAFKFGCSPSGNMKDGILNFKKCKFNLQHIYYKNRILFFFCFLFMMNSLPIQLAFAFSGFQCKYHKKNTPCQSFVVPLVFSAMLFDPIMIFFLTSCTHQCIPNLNCWIWRKKNKISTVFTDM